MHLFDAVPTTLALLTVLGAVVSASIAGHWIEVHFGPPSYLLRRRDLLQLWGLRAAGVWLVFWLLAPVVFSQPQPPPSALDTANAQQIVLNNQRLATIESRVAVVEALRLDARLALLEDTRATVKAMSQWMLGIVGGIIVIVITQILAILGRTKERSGRSG